MNQQSVSGVTEVVCCFLNQIASSGGDGNPLDTCIVDWLAGALSQDEADVEEHLSDLEEMLASMCPAFGAIDGTCRLGMLVELVDQVCGIFKTQQ